MSRFIKKLAALLVFASPAIVQRADALTNGTLLPTYLCGPPNDALPKSLGGVLPFFVLATNPTTADVIVEGVAHKPNRPLDAVNGGTLINTQLLVAGFHNGPIGSIAPFKFVIGMTINPIPDPIKAPAFVPTPNTIVPGFQHTIQLQSTPNDLKVFDDNVALDGAIVYAVDAANAATRVGSFAATGDNMQVWAACGPNAVGVVHNQLLSDNGHYDGLIWAAPANLAANKITSITFKGAAVTDAGFGAHANTFPVVAAPAMVPKAPVVTQVLKMGTAKVTVFFVDPQKSVPVNPVTGFTVNIAFKDAKGVVLNNGMNIQSSSHSSFSELANPATTKPAATAAPTIPATTAAAAAGNANTNGAAAAATSAPAAAAATTHTVTFPAAKSPAKIAIADILAKATAAGVTAANIATMTFTVTATNAIGTSLPSNAVNVKAPPAANTPAAAAAAVKLELTVATNFTSDVVPRPSAATQAAAAASQAATTGANNVATVAALCDPNYTNQLNAYGMSSLYDLDGACQFQDDYTAALITAAGVDVAGVNPTPNSAIRQAANGVFMMISSMVAYYATNMVL